MDNDSKSNMGKGQFTICGHETITNSIEGVHNFQGKKDGTPIKVISKAHILSFFKVEPTDCGVKTYKLVKEDGTLITDDPIITYNIDDDTLDINMEALTLTPFTVFVEATTLGGKVNKKELSIMEVQDSCVFEITPDVVTIVLPYKLNEQVIMKDVLTSASSDFKFLNGDPVHANCPINKVLVYSEDSDYPDNPESTGNFERLNFAITEDKQGKSVYKFAIGTENVPHHQ